MLFAAFGIRSQNVLLRLTNRRLYIGPHVQEYLAGLDAEREERLTRWTLGVQNALEDSTALPPVPGEAAPLPRRMEPAPERDSMMRGRSSKKKQFRVPQRATRTREAEIPRQRNSPERPRQGPRPSRQHPGQCQTTRVEGDRSQRVNEAYLEELRRSQEQPG